VRVRTFLPANDPRQTISDERTESPRFHLTQVLDGPNRVATWVGAQVPDGAEIRHTIKVVPRRVAYAIPQDLPVPSTYPPSTAAALRPEKEIQVDAPEIAEALASVGADRGAVMERLRRIHDFTHRLTTVRSKGRPTR
jgi:hypothetical protein